MESTNLTPELTELELDAVSGGIFDWKPTKSYSYSYDSHDVSIGSNNSVTGNGNTVGNGNINGNGNTVG